jgi:phospholipid/cholesterol/gamma-HCH transport system substrate-binding protein
MARQRTGRIAALCALGVALVAVLVVILGTRPSYVVHARFSDAGQLVTGDLVTVGGHQVGSVGPIKLTGNGLADVELDISGAGIAPLRQGTIATIGQLSLTGVANRMVSLSPGVGAAIPSGGTLPVSQTRGIVDLDTLLDSLNPRVRASLQGVLKAGAYFVAQPTASQLNGANAYLSPAFSQAAQLGNEVVADDSALSQLVSGSAKIATALAARSTNLGETVSSTAAMLRELASQRTAIEDTLVRAPTVLRSATRVLGHVDVTLSALDPALGHLQPVSGRLARLLNALLPATVNAIPTVKAVQALVPSAEAALEALPGVERQATPAVRSLTRSLLLLTPILSGLRPYTPDVVAGFFSGVGGATGGSYDANGHYLHGEVTLQGGGSSLAGLVNLLGKQLSGLGPLNGERTGLLAPCPGGGNPPATDRSNPWASPDVLRGTGNICNSGDNQR